MAVIITISRSNAHAVVAQCLIGINIKRGCKGNRIGGSGFASIYDFRILEGEVVVPVNPNYGGIRIACTKSNINIGSGSSGNSTYHGAEVAIIGRCVSKTVCVDITYRGAVARSKNDTSNTFSIDIATCRLAVASVESRHVGGLGVVAAIAVGDDGEVAGGILMLGGEACEGGGGAIETHGRRGATAELSLAHHDSVGGCATVAVGPREGGAGGAVEGDRHIGYLHARWRGGHRNIVNIQTKLVIGIIIYCNILCASREYLFETLCCRCASIFTAPCKRSNFGICGRISYLKFFGRTTG